MDEPRIRERKSVDTYAEDIARVIDSDKEGGLVKKIIHQQQEQEDQRQNLYEKSSTSRIFLSLGIFFVFLAIAMVGVLLFYKQHKSSVSIQNGPAPLIYTDKNVFKEVSGFTKENIAQTVQNEVNTSTINPGGLEGINLTENKKIIGLSEFMKLISGNLMIDAASFVDDNFLMGLVKEGVDAGGSAETTQNLFILLKVRSFSDIFSTMRSWEGKMFSDLHGFFGVDITGDNSYLLTTDFQDGIIENKNARILYDNNGSIVMMYVFADDQSIVITNSIGTLNEVVLRLQSSQVQK